MPKGTHRLAEVRSLALHTEVARQLKVRPQVLDAARARVEKWRTTGGASRHWAERWSTVLAGSVDDVITAITDRGERARDLRQASPFAGALDPRTRWRILRECSQKGAAR
jgi:hypothetical protein